MESKAAVLLSAANISDWTEVKTVVNRHRVYPLVHSAIKDLHMVPAEFRAWAKQWAQKVAHHSMVLARDCIEIDRALKSAGVKPLHFKGPVLAQIAYGSVALKFSNDLDIFVQSTDLAVAISVLENAGYQVLGQDTLVTKRQINAIVYTAKDLAFSNKNDTIIELHWRFTYNRSFLRGAEENLPMQPVTIATGADLHTFREVQMLDYLVVHGAVHHWKRLKWLADLSAFLAQLPPNECNHAISQVSQGAGRDALAQALQLCDTLLGTNFDPKMSDRADAMFEYALARIDGPYEDPKNSFLNWDLIRDTVATRHLYGTSLAAVWAAKSHLIRKADVMALPLPRSLGWLYPFIRLPSYVFRRLRG